MLWFIGTFLLSIYHIRSGSFTIPQSANLLHNSWEAKEVKRNFYTISLRWSHNGRDSVSNHQPHDRLLNLLFRRRSKKTSKLRVTGLCAWNPSGTGEFPAQMASNAENVSVWWRHYVTAMRFGVKHRTKSQNLNHSRLVLLFLPNPLKPGEWSTIILPTKVPLMFEVWWYIFTYPNASRWRTYTRLKYWLSLCS